ncbi:hypothetical protein KXJ69_06730 [Aureisphaera sp. CAU 1614]|uniref:Uncharacterized protein n=1 Tax=Halomarinibacterium sedimenti TaxID=2857106 RepID=A0A9X1FNK9_9FLAO|nr:hypothetical protein [Halomarinibacterium sedimenti]MBW2937796.1 hypothetical protein [Halomarinibacterium sedimenti]
MMKTTYAIFALLICAIAPANAQVGIGTSAPKSMLDIPASNATTPSYTDGILIPRINTFPAVNPGADQDGMLVFLTTATGTYKKGFHYWDNTPKKWIAYNGEWTDGFVAQSRGDYDDNLIYAQQAADGGVDVVILDSGQIGMGVNNLEESLHIKLPGDNDIQLSSASPPDAPQLVYYTTNGTFETPDFLVDGDDIGYFTGKVWTGSGKSGDAANIEFETDGNHSAGSYPTKIEFNVTPSGNTSVGDSEMVIRSTGNVGIGVVNPTAVLEIKAGTSTANSAPLKLTSGSNLSSTEAGAVEYDGTHLYFTPSTSRKILLKGLTNTGNLDFPNIVSRGTAELTMTVSGATVGSTCNCAPNGSIEANLQWSCYVSSSNTVRIRLTNVSTASINPANKSWKVTVIE